MRTLQYRKSINKKIFRIILGSILLLLCIMALAFILIYRVTSVEVVGNTRYSDEEMKEEVLTGPFAGNSLLISWIKGNQKTEDIPFVDSLKVEKVSNHKIRIIVHEKQIIGYVQYQNSYMYFDKDGLVVESAPVPGTASDGAIAPEELKLIEPEDVADEDAAVFHAAVTDVPLIEGLDVGQVKLNAYLDLKDKQVLNTILGITRMVEKFKIQPDRVEFDENQKITLHYGTIRVSIGADNLLEEKISRAAAILPKLEGKSGILHLEDYTEGTQNIFFAQDVAGDQDAQETGSSEVEDSTAADSEDETEEAAEADSVDETKETPEADSDSGDGDEDEEAPTEADSDTEDQEVD